MIRAALAVVLAVPVMAQTAEPGQLDASQSLFSVMAAINAAGYDSDLDSPLNSPVRALVRREVAARKPAVLDDLRAYFKAHRRNDWSSELAQYVSFALSVDGPPDFNFRYKPIDLPPDVVPLEGFRGLLARFYREANVAELWERSQPAFEEMIRAYQKPSIDALMSVNAYLRSVAGTAVNSRFQIYVDLLGAPNQVHTRSYRNDYYVVVTPSAEPQAFEIRHAYLHYLVDPLVIRWAAEMNEKRPLIDFALGAPALQQFYKDDFLLLSTESLIKAIESRLARETERNGMVEKALSEGFILTAAFAEGLSDYEKQEQALRFYFPNLIRQINLRKEAERLDRVQFAREREAARANVVPAEQRLEPTGAYKTLEEAEQAYSRRAFDEAKAAYARVLQETGEAPAHARAYFGLGKIAALENNAALAAEMFGKVLESSPDGFTEAWSLVYLGRLEEARGDYEKARERFQAALAVAGASDAAKKAAEDGLKQETKQ